MPLTRMPVYKYINNLISKGLVVERISDRKRNIKALMVNENNELILVKNEVDQFKKSFLKVIKNIELVKENQSIVEEDFYQTTNNLAKLYEKFFEIYIFRTLPRYTKLIQDKQTLYEIYKAVFTKIIEIQLDTPDSLRGLLGYTRFDEEICTDDDYEYIEPFNKIGLEKDIVELINVVDSTNYQYGKEFH